MMLKSKRARARASKRIACRAMGIRRSMARTHQQHDAALAETWRRHRVGDDLAREALIVSYLPLTTQVAGQLVKRTGPASTAVGLTYDDFVQLASLGLMQAIDRYEPGSSVNFATFAWRRMTGAVYDGIREVSWIPRNRDHNEQMRAMPALEQRLHHSPTDAEIMAELDLSVKELTEFRRRATLSAIASLETPVGDEDPNLVLASNLADPAPDPAEVYDRLAERALVRDVVDERPARKRAMLALHYFHGMNLADIGEAFGVSESRICQILGEEARRLLPLVLENGADDRRRQTGPPGGQERRKRRPNGTGP